MEEKGTTFNLRLTPSEKATLRKAAYKSGMSMTDFVRTTTLQAAELIATGKREELKETMIEVAASLYSASS